MGRPSSPKVGPRLRFLRVSEGKNSFQIKMQVTVAKKKVLIRFYRENLRVPIEKNILKTCKKLGFFTFFNFFIVSTRPKRFCRFLCQNPFKFHHKSSESHREIDKNSKLEAEGQTKIHSGRSWKPFGLPVGGFQVAPDIEKKSKCVSRH